MRKLFPVVKLDIGIRIPNSITKYIHVIGSNAYLVYRYVSDTGGQLIVATLVPNICLYFNLAKLQCTQTAIKHIPVQIPEGGGLNFFSVDVCHAGFKM